MSVLLSLWFVWCVLGGVSLIFALKSMLRWWLAASSAEAEPDIDRMEGAGFESYLARLFADLGYRVQPTQKSHAYGADLILERENTRIVVQVRRQSEYVGVAAIQQVVAAKAMYGCAEAMVVTNTMYALAALHLAQVNGVVLWDRPILLSEIAARQDRRRAERLQACVLHRLRSLSAVMIAGVLLSCGLVGFWRQGFSGVKLSPQPIANDLLPPPDEPSLRAVFAAIEPTASLISTDAIVPEDACGSAVVGVVAALAIREAPSLQSVAVGEIPQGRSIKLVCEPTISADGIDWQLVDYGVGQGWMSRKYLLAEQP